MAQRPPVVTSNLRCDAKHARVNANTNPNTYKFILQKPLRYVHSITLTKACVPTTPVFTLVRTSTFTASGGSTNSFHQASVRMASALGADPSTSSYVATISNPAGTVSLQVYDIVNTTVTDGSGNFRTYNCLVCTGTVNTFTFTDWTLTAEDTSITETVNMSITPPGDNANLFVSRATPPAILHVRLNGNTLGRMQDPFEWEEQWKSYTLYYPSQIVQYSGTKYICNTKHLSTIFTTDVSTNLYWTALAASSGQYASPNDNAFVVFDNNSINQQTYTEVYARNAITHNVQIDNLREIEFQWLTYSGRPYIFPYDVGTRLTAIASTDTVTYERVYQYPALDFEVTHSLYSR